MVYLSCDKCKNVIYIADQDYQDKKTTKGTITKICLLCGCNKMNMVV